ncbi:hypothetical protein K7432_016422 [Basidiobolus ranarum]|uniref:Uncharacterized protein n=1 Tax=Basidiobolus ranarum TaxID=34480 RepID=A0ABR2VLW0_9FUNG
MNDFLKSPQIEENCVEYELYFPFDEQVNEEKFLETIEEKSIKIFSHIQPWLLDYIWNKEHFNLRIKRGDDSDPSYPFLAGSTTFADCIEDEWFIVFLLKEISLIFPECVIRVFDNDGDFLLIEAALYLPEWITPENSQNRVYIHNGKYHIVPIPKTPADFGVFPAGQLSIQKAVEIVRKSSHLTVQKGRIQSAMQERVSGYVTDIKGAKYPKGCV